MSDKPPVITVPIERVQPTPVVYRCSRCGRRFYVLNDFVRHCVLKHKIPPGMAWRMVEQGWRATEYPDYDFYSAHKK